ncbi:hypothetical protein ABQF34_29285 [Mycolicibacterium boenickei]
MHLSKAVRCCKSVVVSAISIGLIALAGCAGAQPSTVLTTVNPVTPSVPGQQGKDSGGDVEFEVNIGECVQLSGTMNDAKIDNAPCGSEMSNYKVVAKANTNEECASDVDQAYYVTFLGSEQGALCLDVDWVEGDCMVMRSSSSDEPRRVPCTIGESGAIRVIKMVSGTADPAACPADTTNYYSYEERKFVACVAEL